MNNQARQIVKAEAIEVLTAINGKNEFYSREEAVARFQAVRFMALKLELLTEEDIAEIKKEAKVEVNGHE